MNLFPWTVFLPKGFENHMAWGTISLFAGFLEKENSLETLIVIFEKVSPKGFLWLNVKDFEISVLTANSRYLQTAALKKHSAKNIKMCKDRFYTSLLKIISFTIICKS